MASSSKNETRPRSAGPRLFKTLVEGFKRKNIIVDDPVVEKEVNNKNGVLATVTTEFHELEMMEGFVRGKAFDLMKAMVTKKYDVIRQCCTPDVLFVDSRDIGQVFIRLGIDATIAYFKNDRACFSALPIVVDRGRVLVSVYTVKPASGDLKTCTMFKKQRKMYIFDYDADGKFTRIELRASGSMDEAEGTLKEVLTGAWLAYFGDDELAQWAVQGSE